MSLQTDRTHLCRSDEIEKLRKLRGWNLDTLARKARISESTLRRWLHGQPAFIENIATLAEVLGTTVDKVMQDAPKDIPSRLTAPLPDIESETIVTRLPLTHEDRSGGRWFRRCIQLPSRMTDTTATLVCRFSGVREFDSSDIFSTLIEALGGIDGLIAKACTAWITVAEGGVQMPGTSWVLIVPAVADQVVEAGENRWFRASIRCLGAHRIRQGWAEPETLPAFLVSTLTGAE